MRRSAYALIQLDHLAHNLKQLRSFTQDAKVISVVKADAYGHGLAQSAKALSQSDAFAVACIDEALALRSTGILHPIICLQGFKNVKELQQIADSNIQTVVHSQHQLKILKSYPLKQSIQVWLKIDTGMGRLGFVDSQVDNVFQQLTQIKHISKIRLMTHFANADMLDDMKMEKQRHCFEKFIQKYPDCECSAANSAASIAYSKTAYDWVRPGLCLYGVSPFQSDQSHPDLTDLKPVMSVHAPIISIKEMNQGDTIGYGGTFTCPQDMRVAVIAMGYADGYPRNLLREANVSIDGNLAPIVGRVSMDMITVDVSNIDVEIGDEVELWGQDISVHDIANAANMLSYELLCSIADHVHRIYR
jgi:alanine racemase